MAVADEDWQKFIAATEEDPDEVETEESEDEEIETDEDDDKKKPKKSDKDDEDDPDPKKDPKKVESEEEDEEDDPEGDDDPKDPPKPRVKQFLNDKGEFDLKRAEKAYVESSKEAVRLNGELESTKEGYTKLLDALATNPKAAEALFGKDGAKKFLESRGKSGGAGGDAGAGSDALDNHPVIQHLQAKMDNDSRKEYDEFVGAHPEAVTDPEKRRLIGEFLKLHGQVYRAQHKGEIPNMKDALEAAYRYHGWELETTSKKEDVAIAAKKAAATRSSGNAKKGGKKNEVSQGEKFFAQKLGVSLK